MRDTQRRSLVHTEANNHSSKPVSSTLVRSKISVFETKSHQASQAEATLTKNTHHSPEKKKTSVVVPVSPSSERSSRRSSTSESSSLDQKPRASLHRRTLIRKTPLLASSSHKLHQQKQRLYPDMSSSDKVSQEIQSTPLLAPPQPSSSAPSMKPPAATNDNTLRVVASTVPHKNHPPVSFPTQTELSPIQERDDSASHRQSTTAASTVQSRPTHPPATLLGLTSAPLPPVQYTFECSACHEFVALSAEPSVWVCDGLLCGDSSKKHRICSPCLRKGLFQSVQEKGQPPLQISSRNHCRLPCPSSGGCPDGLVHVALNQLFDHTTLLDFLVAHVEQDNPSAPSPLPHEVRGSGGSGARTMSTAVASQPGTQRPSTAAAAAASTATTRDSHRRRMMAASTRRSHPSQSSSTRTSPNTNIQQGKHHGMVQDLIRAQVRKCPQCQLPLRKNKSNCNLLQCPQCHTHSCYCCRKVVPNSGDLRQHFVNTNAMDVKEQLSLQHCPLWTTPIIDQQRDEQYLRDMIFHAANQVWEEYLTQR